MSSLFKRRSELGRPDLPLLSVYRDLGVLTRADRDDNYNKPGDDLSKYQVVRRGDLVLNKMKTWQGSIGISDYEGIVSPAYFVCEQIGAISSRFAHHLLRSLPLIGEYAARSKGIRPAQWDLPWDEFRTIEVDLPSPEIQHQIADFLDAELASLDAVVRAKRKLLDIGWERYSAMVEHLSSSAGKRIALRWVGRISYGLGEPPKLSDDGIPIIRATNISRGTISRNGLIKAALEDIPLDRAPLLAAGEILVVRSGAYTGDSTIVSNEWVGSAPGYDLRITPFAIEPRFLAHQLLGHRCQSQIELVRSRAAQPHLNAEDLGLIEVRTAEPKIEARIADQLDAVRLSYDQISAALDRQLGLLDERRRTVIAEAVTGRLSIPGVAA